MTPKNARDISEEFEIIRERMEQEIRDIDKNISKLTRRKVELDQLLRAGQLSIKT